MRLKSSEMSPSAVRRLSGSKQFCGEMQIIFGVGERTNIQDGTIIHVDHDAPTIIAEDVTVGHQCMLHGCKI